LSQKKLHILNGDAISEQFKASFPNQKFLVWREALCQGPLNYEIRDKDFRNQRIDFLNASLSANIAHHLIDELEKTNLSLYEEVILWFEYDLFCQVNLMAAINWLLQASTEIKISILDLEKFQKARFVGLGEIHQEHYPEIFENRIQLNIEEKSYFELMWNKVSKGDLDLISSIKDHKRLSKFNHALKTIALFSNENGLGAAWVEARIIELLKSGSIEQRELIGKVLKITDELGYGDTQIEMLINNEVKKGRLVSNEDHISLPINA